MAAIAAALPPEVDWFSPLGGFKVGDGSRLVCRHDDANHYGPGPVQVACAATSGQVAKKGFLWGALIMLPTGFRAPLWALRPGRPIPA